MFVRRCLALAAFELQNSNIKVIDLAVKYGYNSPDSFARAFQNMHGITPSEARSGKLDHYIGVATTKECLEGMVKLEVDASTWAVFEAVEPFPETLQETWGRIYSEWLRMPIVKK
ncbi:GyrI-like domain-containing protein [Tissierella praeacuta]|uniref:effector binding domain-containing protein n=1 Tax=Tissierella praeacuta TaxID=43131 RepID=UPI0028AACCA7|nr:GyrI-like domain-containing protein [Tissierella praeacuta]